MKFSRENKRIGINLLFINPKLLGGSVVYAKNLIEEISNIDKTNDYYIYINKESKKLKFNIGSNFKIRVLNFNYSSVYLRYFWEQFILPFYLFKDKIDLIHSPGYVTPILSTVKKVVSILDINYKGHSNNMKFNKVRMTVDEPSDFIVIKRLVEKLGFNDKWENYTNLYLNDKTISNTNDSIIRNEGYIKSIKNDFIN